MLTQFYAKTWGFVTHLTKFYLKFNMINGKKLKETSNMEKRVLQWNMRLGASLKSILKNIDLERKEIKRIKKKIMKKHRVQDMLYPCKWSLYKFRDKY